MTQYETLVQALQTLSSLCDGARSEDGMGFNGRDTHFGKSLASQSMSRTLSPKQQTAAIKMLQTYRKQLESHGIQLPTVPQYIGVSIGKGTETPEASTRPVTRVTVTEAMGQFAVRFKYDPAIKARIAAITRRKFDPDTKAWYVPMDCQDELLKALDGYDPDFDDAAMALLAHADKLRDASKSQDDEIDVPNLTGTLMPFQRAGVAFLEAAGGSAIIGDEMGLGKTIQAIGYLALHPELRPAVIVTPASLKSNWANEIDKWLTAKKSTYVFQGKKTIDIPTSDIYIINYDILSAWQLWFEMLNPPILICDEAHMIKNPKSKRTKAVTSLAEASRNVVMLTGTPVMNRPRELYPLLRAIKPVAWSNWMAYAKRYCNAKQRTLRVNGTIRKIWDFNGASNMQELHKKLSTIMIRRLKRDVLKDLPEKRRVFVPIQIDLDDYNDFMEETLEQLEAENNQAAQLVIIEKAKQYVVEQKMADVIEWIDNFLESDEKLILFTSHKVTAAELDEHYRDKVGTAVITGDTPSHQREYMVKAFQENPGIKLFIGNIQAAGVGLTLTAASNVAFVEIGWRPGDQQQAEDRAHRYGQRNSVTAWYLLAKNTIEEKIFELLEAKRQIVEKVTDGAPSDMAFDSEEDITKQLVSELLKERTE